MRIPNALRLTFATFGAVGMMFSACAPQATQGPSAARAEQTAMASSALPETSPESMSHLNKLWQDRLTEEQDFPIGPGDVLEISIANVKEIHDRTVRVDGKGDILLPLVGSVHVAGLTEPQVSDHLANALHKYVYHPQINLLVKTYSSRVVGVMGSVRNPGLYVLNGPDDTIHDLIERAGGLADNASHEVLLSPAPPGAKSAEALAQEYADGAGAMTRHGNAAPGIVNNADAQASGRITQTALEVNRTPFAQPPSASDFDAASAYVVELDGAGVAHKYVNLPLRPGDTLFVPPAGQVSVVGWVYHPSVIPVRHDLTALGAVSAAGGLMYAADPSSVKVLRHEPGDETKVIDVDLAAVQKGEAQDVALQANDIVQVSYSTVKIPGYALYYAAQGIVSFAPAAALVSGL